MKFTEKFDRFSTIDDAIICSGGGYRIIATLLEEDCPDAPDQRQDGFWPSLDPKEAGFIGQGKSIEDWRHANIRAKEIMRCWSDGEWYYAGLVLSVRFKGVLLASHAASLWGVEVNYPDTDNSYLTQIANELLPHAMQAAQRERNRLCLLLCGAADVSQSQQLYQQPRRLT